MSNNANDSDLFYAYKNGYDDKPCVWSSIILRIVKGASQPCGTGSNDISIRVFVDFADKYMTTPDVVFCSDLSENGPNGTQCVPDKNLEECKDTDLACISPTDNCDSVCDATLVGGRFFYANLPTTQYLNDYYFADCGNLDGYELTWNNAEDVFYDEEDGCRRYPDNYFWRDLRCSDETVPWGGVGGPIEPLGYMPSHGNWGGGNITVTPIFDE